MKSLSLAALMIGLLPTVASAGHRDGFQFSFGLGDVGFGYSQFSRGGYGWRHDGFRGGDRINIGFGYSYSDVPRYADYSCAQVYSQPVYVAPAPVVCAPAPVYCAPAPVTVYAPPVVVYSPPVYYRPYYSTYYQPSGYSYVHYYSR